MSDPTVFMSVAMDAPDEVDIETGEDHLSLKHLSDHTPAMPDKCYGCRSGKHAKAPSRRREAQGIAIAADDAESLPFRRVRSP